MAQVYRARLDLAVGDVATATDRARRIVELARAAKDLQLANPCLAFAASVKAELGNRDAAALAREVLEGELRRSLTFRRAVGATRYVREGERLLAAAS